MNAIGIDVSKGKSMAAIMRPFGEVVFSPFEIKHTTSDIQSLAALIHSIEGESRIVMEHTGRYHEVLAHQLSQANLFVSGLIQSLSRTLTMIPSVRLNLIKQMLSKSPAMHLTSGKISNSIMLWMNYAISSKP